MVVQCRELWKALLKRQTHGIGDHRTRMNGSMVDLSYRMVSSPANCNKLGSGNPERSSPACMKLWLLETAYTQARYPKAEA